MFREEHLSDSIRLRYVRFSRQREVKKMRKVVVAHRVCAREILAWANQANSSGSKLSGDQVAALINIIAKLVEEDRELGERSAA